ncbi:MAG TPA: hypothetical protein VK629_13235 [Steroidobacteraceae bacterium]|nr:hypothetical protein [Steroidobacteraceae bacterium]
MRVLRFIPPQALVFLSAALLAACGGPQESNPPAATSGPPFDTTATVAHLMSWIMDPQADVVWAVGGYVITKDGEVQSVPKNDDEWNAIRNAAATVAESGNLLMLQGRARDNGDWMAMARKMTEEANRCVQAAEAKDLDALFTAGGDMYIACTACHTKYVIGESSPAEAATPNK